MQVRRVVTGHASGKSVFVSDAAAPRARVGVHHPGFAEALLWATEATPDVPHAGGVVPNWIIAGRHFDDWDDLNAQALTWCIETATNAKPKRRLGMSPEAAYVREKPVGGRIIYFYVVDEENRLKGVVPTRRLLLNPPETPIRDVMVQRVVTLSSEATVLNACEAFILHRLLALTLGHYEVAWRYTLAIPRLEWRMRLACAWPLLIGLGTIRELARHPDPLATPAPIKIPPREVRALLARSLVTVWSDAALGLEASRLKRRIRVTTAGSPGPLGAPAGGTPP